MENKPVVLKMIPQMNYYDNVVHTLVDMITNPLNKAVFITLYRCSKYSTITNALIKASENMKIPVFVYVETKAAGMKKENKELAKYLKEHGCHVISSVKEIKNESLRKSISKIHFKACLNYAGEASSVFFSTGNFSVPQGVNTEDICVHMGVNDNRAALNTFRTVYYAFNKIFFENFKSEFGFDYEYNLDVIKYDMAMSKALFINRLNSEYRNTGRTLNIYSVEDYWTAILNYAEYSVSLRDKKQVYIRIKTRNIVGDYLRNICEILTQKDITFAIDILVRDHVGDKVRELIREKKYNINIYSGKLRSGYNWHGCYAIINEQVLLTSCDTDEWKDRYEMAFITNTHEVMNGEKNNFYDKYLLQYEFDKELHGFTWKIE